jgi:predicted ATPase
MKIKSLQIQNFKSIENLVLTEPNPFSVFVGPNGAGKSNIFEAILFVRILSFLPPNSAIELLGSPNDVLKKDGFLFEFLFNSFDSVLRLPPHDIKNNVVHKSFSSRNFIWQNFNEKRKSGSEYDYLNKDEYNQFFRKFSKIFLGAGKTKELPFTFDNNLLADGSNMERVLKTLLEKGKKEEIVEWLRVLIPEFKDIEIKTSELSGEVSFVIYEKSTNKPFPKHLVSDGTQNILALLCAVYQSDEPQFLCIEEPENGLHPYVIEALVGIFRNACKEKGHYIWLNTHSETLVRQLTIDEIIVVDKMNGATRARQFQGEDLFGLEMDEAWLTNALGGGLP